MAQSSLNRNNAEAILESLMTHAPIGIIALDDSGTISYVNQLASTLLQMSSPISSLIGSPLLDCIHHLPPLQERISRMLQNEASSFLLESLPIDQRYLDIRGERIGGGLLCFITDHTKMKQMELDAIQTMITGQENERRRIARDIHDGIGPLISYAKLELDAYMDDFGESERNDSELKLQNVLQTLDTISLDLRNLSHHLMPRLLETFGLFSAFNNLTTRINNAIRTKIEFYCNLQHEFRFNKDLELNLYRCGQELLNNAVKYAKASQILVQLIRHDKSLVLMVEDDGIGLEPKKDQLENYGIGLTNIETRVRTLGGTFIIESRKNMGTTASIEIPI